jgi:AcrR family transcriptional regulator
MGVSERRTREKEELRKKILDAATQLFAEEGYSSVSIRKIADRIEYAPSTIYLYFTDKEDLVSTICIENFLLLSDWIDRIVKEGLPPLEMLRSCLRAYIEFGLEHPSYYIVSFCLPEPQRVDHPPERHLQILNVGLHAFSQLCQGIAACMEAGAIARTNVDLAAQSTWMMLHGITSLLLTKAGFPFIERSILIDAHLDNILRALGADCPVRTGLIPEAGEQAESLESNTASAL